MHPGTMKTNSAIPLIRAGLLNPFLAYLGRVGAPIERNLEQHGLPVYALDDPNTLISTRRHMSFIGSMARSQGIEDLGWQVAQEAETGPISAGLHKAIRNSSTLYEALQSMCSFIRRESTQADMWLTESPKTVYLCHRGTFSPGTPGQDEVSLWRVRTALSIIRQFAGEDWAPDETCFAMAKDPGTVAQESLRDCRISLTSDYGWIPLPRTIVSKAPTRPIDAQIESKGSKVEDQAADLVASLRLLLKPYLYGGVPRVDEAADMAGLSRRTFQRRLREAQVAYRDVVQRTRFEAAKRGLEDPDNRIMDVARDVGYDDVSHFSRFFHSVAGATPRAFRQSRDSGS